MGLHSLPGSCLAWADPTLGSAGSRVNANCRRVYTKGDHPAPSSLWWAPANPHLYRRPPNIRRLFWCSLLWRHGSSPLGLCAHSIFLCVLQDWSLCFPQSSRKPIIKSHWPSRPDSLGISVPLLDLQAGNPDMRFRTFTIVQEHLWYYCSPVCGSPTHWVWDLIWLWMHPSYCLAVASSLSLDMGYLLWWVPASSCRWLFNSWLQVLVLSQEMSTCPSSLPSWTGSPLFNDSYFTSCL